MPEAFDAYYHWLGIPPGEQPPHYYRLLGLREFEPDPRAIAAAADRLTLHLRSYQTGPYYQLAGRLLMEVAAARSCLLDPPRRAAYDQQLHMVLATRPTGQASYPYATPPGGQYSPEHRLASPPPPGSGAPASPAAGPYAQQPFAAPSAYPPATFAAPMAYPPTMSPVPTAYPPAPLPAPTVYPSAPLAAPSGYPPSRPPAPAPYPGAVAAPSPYPGSVSAAPSTPPWTVEASEDDSELPSSGQSVRRMLRRTFRRRDQGNYYLIAGLVGLASLIVIFGILLARHPLDRMFDAYPRKRPAPQSPTLKPKPPVMRTFMGVYAYRSPNCFSTRLCNSLICSALSAGQTKVALPVWITIKSWQPMAAIRCSGSLEATRQFDVSNSRRFSAARALPRSSCGQVWA